MRTVLLFSSRGRSRRLERNSTEPDLLPANDLIVLRELLWRDRLHLSKEHGSIQSSNIDRAVGDAVLVPIERQDVYSALGAYEAFGCFAALPIMHRGRLVFDPNCQRAIGIGHVGSPVLAAEIAVTASRRVRFRRPSERHRHGDVAAVATARQSMHCAAFVSRTRRHA